MVSKESFSTAEATLPCLFFTTVHHKPLCEVAVLPLCASQSLLVPPHDNTTANAVGGSNITPRLTNSQTLGLSETSGSGWLQLLVHAHTPETIRTPAISHKLHISVQSLTTGRCGMLSEVKLNLDCL